MPVPWSFRVRVTLIIAAAVLTLATVAVIGRSPAVAQAPTTTGRVVATVTTDRSMYRTGEPITFTLTLTNQSDEPALSNISYTPFPQFFVTNPAGELNRPGKSGGSIL